MDDWIERRNDWIELLNDWPNSNFDKIVDGALIWMIFESVREMADEFGVTVSAVASWREGRFRPRPRLERVVIETIRKRFMTMA